VSTQLPGNLPSSYKYAVGETCIIFADDTSQTVYAFDINYGDWQVLLVPTELDWIDAEADGNAAMIYNDSIVVGYSAITNTFSAINYTGALITISGDEYGCIDNFAFFVTDLLFYVFDVEDATWHSFSYTPPGAAPWEGGVGGKRDYIYLNIGLINEYPQTVAAYSLHTKTFAQSTEENVIQFSRLDHGFSFIRSGTTPYLVGCYSAYTGQFEFKTHDRLIGGIGGPGVPEELVSPLICHAFATNEQISGNNYRYYFWAYNTLMGNFAEYTFEYTYNGSNYDVLGGNGGGQHAYVLIRNVDAADTIECVLYSALTHSFSHFVTPLVYWGNWSISSGGSVFDSYDESKFYLYDVATGDSYTQPVYWTSSPGVLVRPLGNYWNIFAYKEYLDDTLHVFSYNRTYNNFHTFDVKSNQTVTGLGGGEFYRILVQDSNNEDIMLLFSPNHDTWIEKNMASTSYWGGEGNYCYINYTSLNQTYFYDGQSNQEHLFPSAQQSQDVFARDSVFLMYSNEGKYIGYSMNEHASSEYTVNKFTSEQWANFIVLNLNIGSGSQYELLLYDGYNNIFAPLTLTTAQGIRRISWPGGKTAFVASQNGYLFAYFPNNPSAIEDKNNFTSGLRYTLSQNYPNPFNPSTTINWQLPEAGLVTLKIFDVLGKELITLVDEELKAGEHEAIFDASHLSSGIYFYQLKTGKFIQTKKMILLK